MLQQNGIQKRPIPACLQAFLFALAVSAVIFLPFVIMDHGLFFYYGDFNVQQIPFYRLVHDAVRAGDWRWNWETDLGANFIGSYGFYNLFSPFFWLTLPFPSNAVPYLMAPLLVLKTASAALTSCLYIGRFTRERHYAIFGSLLYAFSGWATYNIFFNHFHEVLVFFPLMLWTLERLVADGKRGGFLLAVALNCMVNYWFFIGSALFTILYVLVRTLSHGWQLTFKKFCAIAFEAVLGVLLAGFALLPSVMAILGNPRTTGDNLLTGWGFWLYSHEQRQPAILESIFFPPDIPSRPNFFPDHGAKWASLSAWLPMIGPSFLLAYLLSTPHSWVKRMLYLCLSMALVPGLNSFFILFNNSYYARWFYMPILLMALASALALERYLACPDAACLLRGLKWTAIISALFILAVGLTPHEEEEKTVIGLEEYPERFWIYAAIVALGLVISWLLVHGLKDRPDFFRLLSLSLACICAVYSVTMLVMGRAHSDDREWLRTVALPGRDELSLPEEEGSFARSDLYESMDNLGMFWGLPNIQAFHSIVPVSLMEFYPSVGVKRDVSSKPQPEYYALRALLSVRWLFVAEDKEEKYQPSTRYFTYWSNQLGYNIYENDNYLPMGFGYRYYVTRTEWEKLPEDNRQKLLLRAVLIEDDASPSIRRIIDPLPEDALQGFSEERFLQDVQERRESVSLSLFTRDNKGFTSRLQLPEEQIIFYSVPYDKGWSATVNGEPTRVLKVNGGFVGVPVPAGESTVRFDYCAPGLRAGMLLSLGALCALLLYLFWGKRHPLPAAARWAYPDLPYGESPFTRRLPSPFVGPPPFSGEGADTPDAWEPGKAAENQEAAAPKPAGSPAAPASEGTAAPAAPMAPEPEDTSAPGTAGAPTSGCGEAFFWNAPADTASAPSPDTPVAPDTPAGGAAQPGGTDTPASDG